MSCTIAKFGGTSVGSPEAMLATAKIVRKNANIRVVLLSAVSGVTNSLIDFAEQIIEKKYETAEFTLQEIIERHRNLAAGLNLVDAISPVLTSTKARLFAQIREPYADETQLIDSILAEGELLSTQIFTALLQKMFTPCEWTDARELIATDSHFGKAQPDTNLIRENCKIRLERLRNKTRTRVYVTQGFIGRDPKGRTTTLGRGGSDYSAALVAEAVAAEELQIWTDVAGIKTIDPRVSRSAQMIPAITFDEAAELASFGAKILHPATMEPARRSGIRVFVGSTFDPEAGGTIISSALSDTPTIRAIALRRKQTLITVTCPRMLNAHGFLARLFSILAEHEIPIDLVTTSEVSVALTIDSANLSIQGESVSQNRKLMQDLRAVASVRIEENLTLVALIGNNMQKTSGISAKTFSTIADINVRLVCQGASDHNLCFLVADEEANAAAASLHQRFIMDTNEYEMIPDFVGNNDIRFLYPENEANP